MYNNGDSLNSRAGLVPHSSFLLEHTGSEKTKCMLDYDRQANKSVDPHLTLLEK